MESMENLIPNDFQGGVLVLKDGQISFVHCQGRADLSMDTPFTPDTTIALASLSKQFIAVATLFQMEQGQLSLDTTIDIFFPHYAPAKKITIRNLLHHSSGIPDYISDKIIPEAISKYELEHGIPPNDILEFNRCIIPKCWTVSLSKCFELINELSLHFEPNTGGRYSNTNYFLLGHILEMVTGKQLTIVMNEIFKRFGLKHTHMNGRMADACGYVKNKNKVFSCGRPSMDSGDGGVISSLNDFGVWCNAILNTDVLTVESWKECLDFSPEPYGCGFWRFENGWFGHDGGLPGLRHWQRLNFEHNTAIIILSNVVIDELEFLTKFMNHVIQ